MKKTKQISKASAPSGTGATKGSDAGCDGVAAREAATTEKPRGEPCSVGKWCPGMEYALADNNRHGKGLSVFWTLNLKSGDMTTHGILYKRSPRDTGIIFNVCPFCAAPINGLKETATPAAPVSP